MHQKIRNISLMAVLAALLTPVCAWGEPNLPTVILPESPPENPWLTYGWPALTFGVVLLLGAGFWRTFRQKQGQEKRARSQAETIEKLKKRLRSVNKEARQLKTERAALIDLIARDLHAPLLRSDTLLDLADEAGKLNPTQRQFLELIRASNAQGNRLIRHITTIRDLENTTDEYPLSSADFAAILRTSVEKLRPVSVARDSELLLDAPEQLQWQTHAEALRELIMHLLLLCIHGSPTRSTIAVSLAPNGKKCRLRVKSEGPALTEEELEQMLHPFYQLGGTQPENTELSGIEIGVVKAYARKLNALVDAESEAGKGTEFLVDFPK